MVDISFERVSKKYRIRRQQNGLEASRIPLLRKLQHAWSPWQEFWALRDVSFAVRRGEALGIIGPNGAGKSTILKLLSNITAPTSGRIIIDGRLSALIEIGSGFHPELTGRENIYLNGSLLGMRRREIAAKLDDIVDFAEVRQFIDEPIKQYSSGMHVRLGFAIAAHLDCDVLLLDEVLAVGDAAFQTKCIRRIDQLKSGGKTIVFVSHDLGAVERLCDRVLLLQRGEVVAEGSPSATILEYQRAVASFIPSAETDGVRNTGSRQAEVTFFALHDGCGRESARFRTGEPLRAQFKYRALEPIPDASFHVLFFTADNQLCSHFTSEHDAQPLFLSPGEGTFEFLCPELGLPPGIYHLDVGIKRLGAPSGVNLHWLQRCLVLRVDPGKIVRGKFHMLHTWQLAPKDGP